MVKQLLIFVSRFSWGMLIFSHRTIWAKGKETRKFTLCFNYFYLRHSRTELSNICRILNCVWSHLFVEPPISNLQYIQGIFPLLLSPSRSVFISSSVKCQNYFACNEKKSYPIRAPTCHQGKLELEEIS